MAVGYSTFANRGVHNDPILIAKIEQVDEDGDVEVIDQAVPTGERVLSEEQADLVTYCLQEVVKGGTGASAAFGKPAAGKTGTTQDNKDAWFVGYTPKLTAAVWLGYADPLPDGTRADHGRGLAGEPEPRPQRRHRRQPPRRDLAQVHGGGHRGRRHRLVRRSPAELPGHGAARRARADHHHRADRRPPAPRPRAPRRRPSEHDHAPRSTADHHDDHRPPPPRRPGPPIN